MTRVLLVDDDPAIGRLIRLLLATEQIEVDRAASGEAALDLLLKGNQPDVILLDLSMPGMDGRQVFREARRAGVTCPVIVCSAYGAEAANQALGGQGSIEKPFSPEILIDTIRLATTHR